MSVPAQVPISGPYIANGSTTQFAYKFYLLFATDLKVYVGGQAMVLNKDYTVTGVGNSQGGNIVFSTIPPNGFEVLIKRATPYTRQTSYADNGDLLAAVVNDDFDRVWLALQEINASFSSSISKPVGGDWDSQGLRITNLAGGTQPGDAANLAQLLSVNGSAGLSADSARQSMAAAKTSETNAAGSADTARQKADSAAASQASAKTSEANAAASAANAAASERNAKMSESNASTSETNAAASAVSAKADADRAQTANPDNQLKKASNLSDIPDASRARSNLGLRAASVADIGVTAGTVAAGDDRRLNTVDNKTGGTLSSFLRVNSGISAGSGDGMAVEAAENNRVELNNNRFTVGSGTPVGWAVFRWYNELVQTGIRRAGDSTIQSYFIAMSNVGSWEFGRNGIALSPGGWQTGSDMRHKTDIKPVTDALPAVLAFNGVTYVRKDGGPEVGLIAQDVEKACPQAISYNGNRKFLDGTVIPDFKYLNTAGASAAYHTEAIKSLVNLIDMVLNKPDDARAMLSMIRAKSSEIAARTVESKAPWKEAPFVLEVPSNESAAP